MTTEKITDKRVPDFSVPHDEVRSQHIEKLNKAKAFIAEASKSKKAVEIKIPGGVVMTTCPEKWSAHLETL